MRKHGITLNKRKYGGKYNKTKKHKRKNKNIQNSSQNFARLNCSPSNTDKSYTCYTDDDLIKLKHMWNLRHPDRKLVTNDSKEIWKTLKFYYSNICNKESCWVKQMAGNNANMKKELMESFAPQSPKTWETNPNEWLSTLDIVAVMNQYEKKYKCFDFIGPSPIDFDKYESDGKCVWEELCNFSLKEQIAHGKTKIGIIFNTDTHDNSGEHWISLFINVKNKQILYFDSVGKQVPREIKHLSDKIIRQGKQLTTPIHFTFDQNYPVEHQYGDTECGVYSLFFIVQMLKDNISAQYLKTHILKDKYIQQFRRIFFNKSL